MAQDKSNTWQGFAKAASLEYDSEKLMRLLQQLHEALDNEDHRGNRRSKNSPRD